jgi:hypothetical protein
MVMLKNYKNELIAIVAAFSLISYAIYVAAAEPVKTKTIVVKAKKEVAKPAKEVKPAAEPAKKDPNRKKPTLKKKYADK